MPTLRLFLAWLVLAQLLPAVATGPARAEGPPTGIQVAPAVPAPFAETPGTPMAGAPGRKVIFGHEVEIPAWDRSRVTALTFGGSGFFPPQGRTDLFPLAALYFRRGSEEGRGRGIVAIFMNELEFDRYWHPWEWIATFDSSTLPYGQTVVTDGREIGKTAVFWGTALGGLGLGYRIPVAPLEVDNDLRLQLMGRAGYFFARRNDSTGASQIIPPDTPLYGARLRGRYDGLRRNILELPHRGIAAGFDLDYLHRSHWRAVSDEARANRDFLQGTGYLVTAADLPGLSEKNRLLLGGYAGTTLGEGRGDRYNAFRINGSPLPGESDELAHPRFQAAVFDDALVTDYLLASIAYRRELLFFLYLTLEGSFIRANRATIAGDDQVVFRRTDAFAGTIALDSAFFWNSALYLAYAWDSGFIRGGKPGSGVILTWTFAF
ncbi:porin [Geomesophilobacter sediminis]|uniref:Porin n=1 Tax=Geomesophilobacter sediminis TaxID=2798584 RepID=A0A8J7M0P1_9BACT|nr:porin [Geomesophilobacter sediminis]MBJ6726207.1 porin [Geomesophilobacter sediminis]